MNAADNFDRILSTLQVLVDNRRANFHWFAINTMWSLEEWQCYWRSSFLRSVSALCPAPVRTFCCLSHGWARVRRNYTVHSKLVVCPHSVLLHAMTWTQCCLSVVSGFGIIKNLQESTLYIQFIVHKKHIPCLGLAFTDCLVKIDHVFFTHSACFN